LPPAVFFKPRVLEGARHSEHRRQHHLLSSGLAAAASTHDLLRAADTLY
jgi:hypothetical protein